jgi:hypothetical protein
MFANFDWNRPRFTTDQVIKIAELSKLKKRKGLYSATEAAGLALNKALRNAGAKRQVAAQATTEHLQSFVRALYLADNLHHDCEVPQIIHVIPAQTWITRDGPKSYVSRRFKSTPPVTRICLWRLSCKVLRKICFEFRRTPLALSGDKE